MAEGFARSIGGDLVEAYSAGTNPTGLVSEKTIAAMKEKGIDISGQHSKSLEEVSLEEMDIVVSMAGWSAEQLCPSSCHAQKLDWYVEDPIGRTMDRFRMTRDELEEKVKRLLESIWKG